MSDTSSKNTIYSEIRRTIIMGHRKPGDRFNVEELADHYQTSITPIRDALQMLGQEGLVTIKPRSGYFVTRITLKELRDMFDLRNILELAAIERTVERITPERLEELKMIHAGYTGDDEESYDRYTEENRRFHYLLAAASGNHELARTLGHLLDRLARFMVLRHAGMTMPETHARILEALQERDIDESRRVLFDDIKDTFDTSLERIMETEADAWHLEM
ncbi:MAG: GntR family transcriptional regulator [Anaerolineales bacterium]|nr:GntR family transcriptional regulator [Anaerolineales bacterium]